MTARERIGRSLAIARFATAANFRRWLTRGGLLAGIALMALGPILSFQRGAGWRWDPDLGLMGFFVMALFSVRSGLEEQRELGLALYLRRNLVQPLEHAIGLLLALLSAWGILCGVAFLAILALSAGDLHTATWSTAALGTRLLVLIGFVPLIEAVATLRLPLIVPAFAYAGLVIALTLMLPEEQALALFIPVEHGRLDQLARLALQGAASFTLTAAGFLAFFTLGPALLVRIRKVVRIRYGDAPVGQRSSR